MRISVIQATWTPHSVARIDAARELFRDAGDHIEATAVAAVQSDYGHWPPQPGARPTLFPDIEYWNVPTRSLRERLRSWLQATTPDVVVVPGWAFGESRAALGWAIDNDVPRVVVSDSQKVDLRRRPVVEWAKRHLIANFDAAFVGGTSHVAYLAELGFDPAACFPGCDVVDNEFFAAPSGKSPSSPPVLLSCLRLLPSKNIPAMLERLDEGPWVWKIAGDGPERAPIERRVHELGLEDRVELLGSVSYPDLPRLHAAADVYLQPSVSEPWGLAVNEAMAASMPVLVSERCGCSHDLVEQGSNGWTFDPTDPGSTGRALAEMLAAKERWPEMGSASLRIVSEWGLDLYARNLRAACLDAIRRTRRRRGLAGAIGRLL